MALNPKPYGPNLVELKRVHCRPPGSSKVHMHSLRGLHGWTALEGAARAGRLGVAKCLVSAGGRERARQVLVERPLLCCHERGHCFGPIPCERGGGRQRH